MQNQQTNPPSFETDNERVHGFFQDLAAALNRISGKTPPLQPTGQGLPTPIPGSKKQRSENKQKGK